jgi:hypothetical protein
MTDRTKVRRYWCKEEYRVHYDEYWYEIPKGDPIEAVQLDEGNADMLAGWLKDNDVIPVPGGILIATPSVSEWDNADCNASLSWAFFVPFGDWIIKTTVPYEDDSGFFNYIGEINYMDTDEFEEHFEA